MLSVRSARTFFFISLAFLGLLGVFAAGLVSGHYETWPYPQIKAMKIQLENIIATDGRLGPDGLYVRAPSDASMERLVLHDSGRMMPGYRAIMGWDEGSGRYNVWLLDEEGREVHVWPIELSRSSVARTFIYPHGMQILRDGTILVNFDQGNDVLVRLDSCGHAIWSREGIYHHSIELAEDGTFWTWLAEEDINSQHQKLVNLDVETGETRKTIDLTGDLIEAPGTGAALLGRPLDFESRAPEGELARNRDDMFHPNDVEPLSSALSPLFPEFDTGDLLISLRNMDLVAVLDPVGLRFKWWSHGPWRAQHDPDFGSDGRIYVYNNNPGRGRSDVISIDPVTRDVERYFAEGEPRYYSSGQGKLTLIPNGTVQILVPMEGRVLESSWTGRLLFEFNNVLTEEFNSHVINAVWLPDDYFQTTPTCRQ